MATLNTLLLALRYVYRYRHLYAWTLMLWLYEQFHPQPSNLKDLTAAVVALRSQLVRVRLNSWRYAWLVQRLHRLIDTQRLLLGRIADEGAWNNTLER